MALDARDIAKNEVCSDWSAALRDPARRPTEAGYPTSAPTSTLMWRVHLVPLGGIPCCAVCC